MELNKLRSFDKDFSRDPRDNSVWVSPDPRLFSAIRAQRLVLDSPPLNGKVRANDVYNDEFVYDIPPQYRSYQDITNGQIRYYLSKDLAKPFVSQLFSPPVNYFVRYNYADPMGSVKPHYERCSTVYPNSCLSSVNDSQAHREDIMSRLLWKRNQTDYGVNKIKYE